MVIRCAGRLGRGPTVRRWRPPAAAPGRERPLAARGLPMRASASEAPSGALFGHSTVRFAKWAFYHLASFEFVFTLYLYSNVLKPFLPTLPIDETVILAVLSFPIGFSVIARYGVYLPGVPIVTSALLLFGWATLSL